MENLLQIVAAACVASLVGGMVFFPTVVAPSVFKSLDMDRAGAFLRSMFPRYYAYIIVLSGIGGAAMYQATVPSLVMGAIAVSTLWVRQSLMPSINAARDRNDEAAFKRGHMLSVVINMAQLVALVWIGVGLLQP